MSFEDRFMQGYNSFILGPNPESPEDSLLLGIGKVGSPLDFETYLGLQPQPTATAPPSYMYNFTYNGTGYGAPIPMTKPISNTSTADIVDSSLGYLLQKFEPFLQVRRFPILPFIVLILLDHQSSGTCTYVSWFVTWCGCFSCQYQCHFSVQVVSGQILGVVPQKLVSQQHLINQSIPSQMTLSRVLFIALQNIHFHHNTLFFYYSKQNKMCHLCWPHLW